MEPLLSASHIHKIYAGHTALQDVSISVPKGTIFGLLGPNGAGKTSLIRIITQITAPDQGELLFEGQKLAPEQVARMGYLPEERGLYPKMKVGEQAIYLARLKGMPKAKAKQKLQEWFERFEMTAWWNKRIDELSKGMQQKVQFITTVLHEPSLLILDEPFTGFDPINTNLIKEEILRLRKEGTTVIFSTHQMSSVEEICDSIALINRSKMILEGRVQDIKMAYKPNEYEVAFKGHMMGFANALWTGFELLGSEEVEGINKARVKTLRNNTPNNLLQAILPHVEVCGLREILPSMNDIFIRKVTEINKQEADSSEAKSNG